MSLKELQEMSKYTDSYYYCKHNKQITDFFPALLNSTIPDLPEPNEIKSNQERIKSTIAKFIKRNVR